jgi:ER membrane protein complex subunit 1
MSTSTGAVQLWQQDKEQWTREEGLANIAVSEFVELPEMKVIQSHGGEDESFASRVVRQVLDAKVVFPPPMVSCTFIKYLFVLERTSLDT